MSSTPFPILQWYWSFTEEVTVYKTNLSTHTWLNKPYRRRSQCGKKAVKREWAGREAVTKCTLWVELGPFPCSSVGLGVILCTPLLSGGVCSFRVVTVGVPAIASRQLINKQLLCKGSGLLCKVRLWGFELQLRFLCVHLCSVTQGCLEFGSSEAIVLVSNSYRWLGSPGISVGISCMKPLGR